MKLKNPKYIFVIGGVMSGVGKGIASSAIGQLLQSQGFAVSPVKVDPYLNVDAGTMNPTEHGEVFVLNSGLETDQDLGNYERFLNMDLGPVNYMTSGMIYQHVIEKERSLGYHGKCVEAIPHITGEIVRRFQAASKVGKKQNAITLIEIGGTVGDYQNIMFIEAARILKLKHPDDVIFILVSYLPVPGKLGEMKTRPTQNAVRQLNSYGVQPDIIIARSHVPLDERRKEKIALSCNIRPEHVISAPDIESIYDVPINFERDHISEILIETLHLPVKKGRGRQDGLKPWKEFVQKVKKSNRQSASGGSKTFDIAVVGKYFDTGDFVLSDAYISVIEAVKFSAYSLGISAKLHWLNAKDFETGKLSIDMLAGFQGIVVPGGFGQTGIDGILQAITFARENNIPYLGLCYGMQLMVIEYARHKAGLHKAQTTEIDPNSVEPVISIMDDQKDKITEGHMGGSMRLGAYSCKLKAGTIAAEAYGKKMVSERHRHRYEVNTNFIPIIEDAGLVFSGTSPDGRLMEIAELPHSVHPFFLGTQFHPEFLARPLVPHPLFTAFLEAVKKVKKQMAQENSTK